MSAPTAWKFSSTPDSEIQPFFKVRAEGWFGKFFLIFLLSILNFFTFLFFFLRLGSDVATSIQLDGNKYLWVFGDTLGLEFLMFLKN